MVGSNGITGWHDEYLIEGPAIIVGRKGSAGEVVFIKDNCFPIDTTYYIKRVDSHTCNLVYLYHILLGLELTALKGGAGIPGLNRNDVYQKFKIPLPPLKIQQEIVAEIEGYQKIIDGARAVVENYKPKFQIDPEWELVKLGDVCEKITDGSHFSPKTGDFNYPYITVKDLIDDEIDFNNCKFIEKKEFIELSNMGCKPLFNDVLFSKDGTVGKVSLVNFKKDFVVLSSLAIIRPNSKFISSEFLKYTLKSNYFFDKAIENKTGVAIKRIVLRTLKEIKVSLPNLETQIKIVAQIEKEQALVKANKELITLFEQKIKDKIASIWGE